ncbi:TolC family protein [Lutibacter sp.]|uniref:TolC family protein n=1 Tax=Lutibacter sp. TaxID=1925666 RepID=UPI00356B0C99
MQFLKVKSLFVCVVILSCQFTFSQDSISIGLNEAIQLALQKNTNIVISNYQVKKSEFALKEAKANLLPKLFLNASYYRNIERQVIFLSEGLGVGEKATKLGSDNDFRNSLNLSFPIYSNYNFVNKKFAKTQFNFQNEVARGTTHSVINATKKAYFNYLIAQEIVKVQSNRLANAQEFLDDINKRLLKGTLTNFDLTSAKVQVAIAKNNLLEAQSNLLPIVNNLKLVLGLNLNDIVKLIDPLILLENEIILKEDTNQSLQKNSTLKQLEIAIEVNENQLQLIKSSNYPIIEAIGNYNYQTQANNFNFSEFNWEHTSLVGLQIQFSIFNGTVTKKKVEQAEINKKITEEEKQFTAKQFQMQIGELISQLNFEKLKIEVQQENIKLTSEALRLSKKRYQLGVGTILEVNDAELANTQAYLSWLQAVLNYKSTYYDYQLLIGKD